MSGGEQDDLLDGLLKSVRRPSSQSQSSSGQPPADPEPGQSKGLNPLDLLNMAPEQRDLINWLGRNNQARFSDIQQGLGLEAAPLRKLIDQVLESGHIHEALIDGEIYYRVVFGGKVSRAARGLPSSIWERVDLDNLVFLRQIPLFKNLDDDALREVASRLDDRKYRRNEVVMWQGGRGEGLFFIKSGIVGLTRLSADKRHVHILNYLKQGDLFGEYELMFDQEVVTSATVTALSEVDLLVMKREAVAEVLRAYPAVAIELVQLLTRRLHEALQPPESAAEKDIKISLVVGVEPGAGATTIGSALAMHMTEITQNQTVFTEYPPTSLLMEEFAIAPDQSVLTHPAGYDVWVPAFFSDLPPTVRATLLLDKLKSRYANIVIAVPPEVDEPVIYLLQRADQVVLVTPPTESAWQKTLHIYERLHAQISREQTSFTLICNRPRVEHSTGLLPEYADLDVPYFAGLPGPAEQTLYNLPESLTDVVAVLAERLGRTHTINVYLPTYVLQADQRPADMTAVLDKLITYFELLFGNARHETSLVHNSEPAAPGAAQERFHVISTSVTKTGMDRHLSEVLHFTEQIKTDLGLDALALEVNQHVMLV